MFDLESQLEEGERMLAGIWRGIAFRGLLGIAFAVVVLVWPRIGLSALIALFGAFALVCGVATMVAAFRARVRGGQRWWMLFEGLLGVAVGVVVFAWPGLSALGLLYAIAAWAIAAGMVQLALAFALPFGGGRSPLLALAGLLSVAFGVIMFARPGAGAIALLALIAAFALVTGIEQVAWALELRRIAGKLARSVRPTRSATAERRGAGRAHVPSIPRLKERFHAHQ